MEYSLIEDGDDFDGRLQPDYSSNILDIFAADSCVQLTIPNKPQICPNGSPEATAAKVLLEYQAEPMDDFLRGSSASLGKQASSASLIK